MTGKITYRHNVMDLTSLDMFFNIRGGFHNDVKDVYFVRALGECAGFSEKIYEIDKQMGGEVSGGRFNYVRIGGLPNICGGEQIQIYSGIYDRWKASGAVTLSRVKGNELLNRILSDALSRTLEVYKISRKNVSDSMLRNFGIKLLFWLEEAAGSCFEGWNERTCVKAVLENAVKDQEYLFGYFLSLLGCDVLLLENRGDANVPEAMKRLSKAMTLGDYGTAALSRYAPDIRNRPGAEQTGPKKRNTEGQDTRVRNTEGPEKGERKNITVVIPKRAGRQKTRAEKSFEELARLASSIVMITIHDERGEVRGTGSGIMIGRNGYILTNCHVAAGGRSYSVRIEDDETIYSTDELIKYNQALDLAVLRIDRTLEPLTIYRGEKELVRGQKVVAIGSPLGLFNSVSDGIISGFRNIRNTDMIQFTAPISPGSSGGAVLNMYGEVIGISTAGFDSGQNINLAVGYESIRMFAGGFFG